MKKEKLKNVIPLNLLFKLPVYYSVLSEGDLNINIPVVSCQRTQGNLLAINSFYKPISRIIDNNDK